MKKAICAAMLLAVLGSLPAYGAINVIGLEGELEHNSEYLYGYSGGSNARLVIGLSGGGTDVVSTNSNQGWWSATSSNSTSNTNYIVGDLSNNGSQLHNNFFTFDLSSFATLTVVSAALQLVRESGDSSTGQTSHTYQLFDVSTPAATLNANDGTSQAIFDDLGSGVSYGSFSVTVAGSSPELLSFNLNSAGVAGINSLLGSSAGLKQFSIGGTLTPGDVEPPTAELPEVASFVVWGLLVSVISVIRGRIA